MYVNLMKKYWYRNILISVKKASNWGRLQQVSNQLFLNISMLLFIQNYKLIWISYLRAPSELSTRSANHGIDWDDPWRWMMSNRKSGWRLRHSKWPIRCVEFRDCSCSKTSCGGFRGGPVGSIVISYKEQVIKENTEA